MIRLRSLFDHGGDQYAVRSIPFIISGPKIKKGHLIQNEVRIFDIFNTFSKIQNLKNLPKSWIGRNIEEVFSNPFTKILKGYKVVNSIKHKIKIIKTKSFKTILKNKRGINFKVLRPINENKDPNYYPLGDVVHVGKNKAQAVVMVPLLTGFSSHPIAFEKVLNNRGVVINLSKFTTWAPSPLWLYMPW